MLAICLNDHVSICCGPGQLETSRSSIHLLIHTHTSKQTHMWDSRCHLLDAVGPALVDAVPGPHVVCVLSQFVNHGLLGGGQFDVVQVQRSRFITTGQLVAAQIKVGAQRGQWVKTSTSAVV